MWVLVVLAVNAHMAFSNSLIGYTTNHLAQVRPGHPDVVQCNLGTQVHSRKRGQPQMLETLNQVGWFKWLPGLLTLRRYQLVWLAHDFVAALATMLVPVGIAYAVASGVPGIYGLYASIAPLIAYAVFGPSRILVLGPDSSLAAVIFGHRLGVRVHNGRRSLPTRASCREPMPHEQAQMWIPIRKWWGLERPTWRLPEPKRS
jgi:hypothetical protein